jgi:hypothetical protein
MNMKKKFGLMMVVALLGVAASSVQAQQYRWTNVGATNNVPNNSTTSANLGSVITATRYGEVAIDIAFALDGSGTTACNFKFLTSVDGTNYNTTAPITITQAPNGTTTVRTNTSISLGAVGYIKLGSITAANNSAAMTNIVVGYSFKPSRVDGK